MIIFAAILFAALSPLASPSDYVFAPFTNNANAAAFIKGEIMGKDADYKSIRAEDLAFLQEAFGERSAMASGSWRAYTNATECLKINDFYGWSINPNAGTARYLQSSSGLPSGMFMCDYGKAVTNVTEYSWNSTNVIDRTVTAITNWVYGGTNSFRADWPPIAALQVIPVTNYIYEVTNVWQTNVSYMTWMDCITTNRSVFARKGTNDHYVSSGGILSLHDNIPLFAAVTNMYETLARGKYLLAYATPLTASNVYDEVITRYNYDSYYYDDSTSSHSVDWKNVVVGPTTDHYLTPRRTLSGIIYSVSGSASTDASWSSYRSGDGWIYVMSPANIYEQSTLYSPSNGQIVAEIINSHMTTEVATMGNHTRIKANTKVYQPFMLQYSESETLTTPTGGSNRFDTIYSKSGTAYAMAVVDGLCDYSGTNLVKVTANIDTHSVFDFMASSVDLLYSTPASISASGLPAPRDASYEYEGQTIHDSTSSRINVSHDLSIVGSPIILYTCDFSADVN